MVEMNVSKFYEAMDRSSTIPKKITCAAPYTRKPIPPGFSLAGHNYIVANSEEESRAEWDRLIRRALLRAVFRYRSDQYFGPEKAELFLLRPGGDISSLTLLSSGFSWIGMHVGDKICVVTMVYDLLCKRPANKTQLYPYYLLKSAVADMMGAMLPADDRRMRGVEFSTRRMLPLSIDGPYAVVSVAPCGLGREERAICALSYLFGREFDPSKIEVCGWGNGADGEVIPQNKETILQALGQFM